LAFLATFAFSVRFSVNAFTCVCAIKINFEFGKKLLFIQQKYIKKTVRMKEGRGNGRNITKRKT